MVELFDVFQNEFAKDDNNLQVIGKSVISEFGNDVLKYVDANLEVALTAEIDGVGKNTTGIYINNKAIMDSNYRNGLVTYIAARAVRYSLFAYKANLDKENRRLVFMRAIFSFLSAHQIGLIAEYYDKTLANEKKSKTR